MGVSLPRGCFDERAAASAERLHIPPLECPTQAAGDLGFAFTDLSALYLGVGPSSDLIKALRGSADGKGYAVQDTTLHYE